MGYSFHNDYLAYSTLLIVLTSLPLSLFVFWKNPRDPVSRYFSLFGLSVAGWAAFLGLFLIVPQVQTALTYSRISNLFGLFIYIFFYHYVHSLLNLPYRRFLKIGYGLTLMAALFSLLFPHLWIDRLSENIPGLRYYTHGRWLYGIHPFLGCLFPGFAQVKLIERYRQSGDEWRKKCFFMLLATGVGFIGGFTSFFMVFDVLVF